MITASGDGRIDAAKYPCGRKNASEKYLGYRALNMAAHPDYIDIVKFLLDHGDRNSGIAIGRAPNRNNWRFV